MTSKTREARRTMDAKAAAALGISPNAIYEAMKRGEIPLLQIGSRKLIPGDWVDRKLEELKNN
jgi:predicted DNA-binding transcriptional regulator AlpA